MSNESVQSLFKRLKAEGQTKLVSLLKHLQLAERGLMCEAEAFDAILGEVTDQTALEFVNLGQQWFPERLSSLKSYTEAADSAAVVRVSQYTLAQSSSLRGIQALRSVFGDVALSSTGSITMNLAPLQLQSILNSGHGYVAPEVRRFVVFGMGLFSGPYQREHRFDTFLEREVEYCEEHINTDRSRFIAEAKIGALSHPNILPTYDFGFITNRTLFVGNDTALYFTRPFTRPGVTLYSELRRPFESAAKLALLDEFDQFGGECLSRDDFETCRHSIEHELEDDKNEQLILATRRTGRFKQKRLVMPTRAVQDEILVDRVRLVETERKNTANGLSEAGEEHLKRRATRRAVDSFLFAVARANNIELSEVAYSERLVVLNLRYFLKVLMAVSDTIDFAHQHDIWHLHLSPKTIGFGLDDRRVYVERWDQAYVKDAPWKPDFAPAKDEDEQRLPNIAELVDERIQIGPTTDVFSLGGILASLLYEPREDSDEAQLRSSYLPRDDALASSVGEMMVRLQSVSRRALAFHPNERQATAGEFLDDVRSCMVDTGDPEKKLN